MRFAVSAVLMFLLSCSDDPPSAELPSPGSAITDYSGRWNVEPIDSIGGRVMWQTPDRSAEGSAVGFAPGGQVDSIMDVRVEDDELRFRTPGRKRVDGRSVDVMTESRASLADGVLEGVTIREGVESRWRGRRAPEIAELDDGSWEAGEPLALFDGSPEDLSAHWTLAEAGDWIVRDGVLMNSDGAGLLTSRAKFWNFELHIEYRAKKGQNGGIGLRSRYEIQILGDHGGAADDHANGAVYSRLAPRVNATLPPEQWQTYDIRLVGRDLTVVLNGETLHEKAPLPGPTAMATDWREGEPGALTLQGDHGSIEFRSIVLTPLTQ